MTGLPLVALLSVVASFGVGVVALAVVWACGELRARRSRKA